MEQNVANEIIEEVAVENVVEDIVEVTKPETDKGVIGLVIGGICAAALAVGGFFWFKKSKKAKAEKEKAEMESKDENWADELEAVAKEKSIDDLAE